MLKGLKSIIIGEELTNETNIKSYKLDKLLVGMKVHQNIIDEDGNILSYQHDQLDSLKILEIAKISKTKRIIEPIYIYE